MRGPSSLAKTIKRCKTTSRLGFEMCPRPCAVVIARSEATKQSQGGGRSTELREIAAPSPLSAGRMARNDSRTLKVQEETSCWGVTGCSVES
jgi:hypothetical protein